VKSKRKKDTEAGIRGNGERKIGLILLAVRAKNILLF
jgi:hypothetical protein